MKKCKTIATTLTQLMVAVFLSWLFGSSLFAQNSGASNASVISRAESAIEAQNYAAAEPLLKQAVSDNPGDFRAWYDLGFLYAATSRQPEAVDAYRKSVHANPKVFESNYKLGLLLAYRKDPEAEKFLRAATLLQPASHPAEALAGAWLSLGNVIQPTSASDALAAYQEAEKLEPASPEPRLAAGALLENEGKFSDAEKQYQRAVELDPKSADAQLGLANVYQKARRLPEAEAALRKYLFLANGDARAAAAWIQLGRVLTAENKFPEAMDAYERGLKLGPQGENKTAQRELAALYDVAGKHQQAEAVYGQLIAGDPNDANAHAGLGLALLHDHQTVAAQSELSEAVRLNPRLGDAYGDLAAAAALNKNYELALRALDARRQFLPENAGTVFLRATTLDNLRDYKNAAATYRQFLQMVAQSGSHYPDQEWQAQHRLKAIEPRK